MRWFIIVSAVITSLLTAEDKPLPGLIETSDLEGYDKFEESRRKLVKVSLDEAASLKLNKYVFGSADPKKGGFDCSGSVYYLLKKMGIEAPRSSSAQYDWLKENGTLQTVPKDAENLDHPSFSNLKPGDLLFWSGTYEPTDGRKNNITHVQIYLGREKDGDAVMIGSSDGRSYERKARCGFGVFDFKLPRKGSKARFAGYGTPLGL